MKFSLILAILMLPLFGLPVLAENVEAAPDSLPAAPAAPDSATATDKSETISAETTELDSLGILPSEPEPHAAGGTRRNNLESAIFRREAPVEYAALGRRDPFRALIVDEKKEGEVETDLLRVEGAILSGVVWSTGQYLAIVKDKDGRSFFLREGDPVYLGHLVTVTQSQATFEVSDFGEYDHVTLKVKGKS